MVMVLSRQVLWIGRTRIYRNLSISLFPNFTIATKSFSKPRPAGGHHRIGPTPLGRERFDNPPVLSHVTEGNVPFPTEKRGFGRWRAKDVFAVPHAWKTGHVFHLATWGKCEVSRLNEACSSLCGDRYRWSRRIFPPTRDFSYALKSDSGGMQIRLTDSSEVCARKSRLARYGARPQSPRRDRPSILTRLRQAQDAK